MTAINFEKNLQALFIGNTYKKNTTDNERGYPAIVRDVLAYFRATLGDTIPDSQLEVKMKTGNIIGGEQENLTVTVSFKGGGTLAALLFFVSTKENKEDIRINDVWVTAHRESWEEERRRKQQERDERIATGVDSVEARPVETIEEEPEKAIEAEAL